MVQKEVSIIKITILFLVIFICNTTFSQIENSDKLKIIIKVEKIDSTNKRLFNEETLTSYESKDEFSGYLIKKNNFKKIKININNSNYIVIAYQLAFVYRGDYKAPKLIIGNKILKKDALEFKREYKKRKNLFEYVSLSNFIVIDETTFKTELLEEYFYIRVK